MSNRQTFEFAVKVRKSTIREEQQIHVQRNYWHTFEGTTKTRQRIRFVAVTAELREMLLAFWKEQGSPLDGYILAAPEEKGKPVILENLVKRTIRTTA